MGNEVEVGRPELFAQTPSSSTEKRGKGENLFFPRTWSESTFIFVEGPSPSKKPFFVKKESKWEISSSDPQTSISPCSAAALFCRKREKTLKAFPGLQKLEKSFPRPLSFPLILDPRGGRKGEEENAASRLFSFARGNSGGGKRSGLGASPFLVA